MVSRLASAVASVARTHPFGTLFGLHVLLTLVLLPRVIDVTPVGDEAAYLDGARALGNLVRDLGLLQAPDRAELERNVVASGWFMPGTSILLAPLYLLVPDAGDAMARLYLTVASSLLLLWAARSVGRLLGERYALALLVFPGLVPMWVLFSYTSWGDLPAGLVAAVLIARVVVLGRSLIEGRPIAWGDGVRVGLLLVGVIYLRSSAKPLVAGLGVLLVLGVLLFLAGRSRIRSLGALALAGAVFAVLLAPWAMAASATLGTRVVTTTTLPVSLGNTFGDRDRLCYGPCDPDSTIWFAPLRYSREVARATGSSEVEIQGEMADYALKGAVTPRSYADDVSMNLNRYLLRAPGFEWHLGGDNTRMSATALTLDVGTVVLYFPALVLVLALMVAVTRGRSASLDRRLRSVLFKLCALAFLVQPFVHVGSSRYWPIFAPLMAFAAVWWWEGRRGEGGPTIQPARYGAASVAIALRRIEVGLAVGFGALLTAVLVLGVL